MSEAFLPFLWNNKSSVLSELLHSVSYSILTLHPDLASPPAQIMLVLMVLPHQPELVHVWWSTTGRRACLILVDMLPVASGKQKRDKRVQCQRKVPKIQNDECMKLPLTHWRCDRIQWGSTDGYEAWSCQTKAEMPVSPRRWLKHRTTASAGLCHY